MPCAGWAGVASAAPLACCWAERPRCDVGCAPARAALAPSAPSPACPTGPVPTGEEKASRRTGAGDSLAAASRPRVASSSCSMLRTAEPGVSDQPPACRAQLAARQQGPCSRYGECLRLPCHPLNQPNVVTTSAHIQQGPGPTKTQVPVLGALAGSCAGPSALEAIGCAPAAADVAGPTSAAAWGSCTAVGGRAWA